ncbi:ABC transporter substrate-binding protein [Roseomonas sp. 18066]|uniref:ABC transporter substrate-binding protein n=1 Tax=Roseomonas sp. 18066 TaxID=2681412 RepID=UPI0013586E5A|nr:extracellular solute-binding protein [Roseomonas sp. 18066]
MSPQDRIGRRGAMATGAALAGLLDGLLARPALAQPEAALLRAAEQEGEVVWYTTYIVNLAVRPLAAAFEKKYPKIRLRYVPAPPVEGVTRLLNENRNGSVQADVFDSGTVFVPAHAAGMVAPYKPRAAESFAADYKDPEGFWTGVNLQVATASVNTELVKPADIPVSYDDLLHPRWKGRMAWSDNHSSTGATGFIGNILLTRGPEQGMAYLRALAQQRVATVAAVQRVVLDQNIAGQYPLVLSIYNYHAQISMAEGAPIRWLKMEPVVSSFGTVSVLKQARHPNAARLFIEFLLSEEGQAVLRDANYLPIHPKVPPKVPALMPEAGGFATTIISPMLYAQHEQAWLKLFRDLFL